MIPFDCEVQDLHNCEFLTPRGEGVVYLFRTTRIGLQEKSALGEYNSLSVMSLITLINSGSSVTIYWNRFQNLSVEKLNYWTHHTSCGSRNTESISKFRCPFGQEIAFK